MSQIIKNQYKIVLLGDGAVGKSSLRQKYVGEKINTNYSMTVGVDFSVKRDRIEHEDVVTQIFDLAGQSRHKLSRKEYYKNSNGAIIVFDLTRPKTFQNIPNWLSEFLENNNNQMVPFILIGNKSDLRIQNGGGVSSEKAQEYAKHLSEWSGFHVPYFETNIFNDSHNEDINKVFHKLIKNIEHPQIFEIDQSFQDVSDSNSETVESIIPKILIESYDLALSCYEGIGQVRTIQLSLNGYHSREQALSLSLEELAKILSLEISDANVIHQSIMSGKIKNSIFKIIERKLMKTDL